jgi:hypothetical protein
MKLGDLIRNPVDTRDTGLYRITTVKRYQMVWMYMACATQENCIYATIGGSL